MSPCIRIPGGFVTVGSPTIRMETNRGVVAFEWQDYLGPMPITLKRGREGDERKLPANHPFWEKVSRWCEQGRPIHNGWAVVGAQRAGEESGT